MKLNYLIFCCFQFWILESGSMRFMLWNIGKTLIDPFFTWTDGVKAKLVSLLINFLNNRTSYYIKLQKDTRIYPVKGTLLYSIVTIKHLLIENIWVFCKLCKKIFCLFFLFIKKNTFITHFHLQKIIISGDWSSPG